MRLKRSDKEAAVSSYVQELTAAARQKEQNKTDRKLVTSIVNQTIFLENLEKTVARVFAKPVVIGGRTFTHKANIERICNMFFSDSHYGSNLDPKEVPVAYGPVEEARRTAAIMLQAADFKRQYRKNTRCYVHLGGDIIQGKIHTDGSTYWVDQMCAALHILAQGLAFLATEFPEVVIRATPGNHGRNPHKNPNRATDQKYDSYETFLYYALKKALSQYKNVTVEIPHTPYYTYSVWNQNAFFTHGDGVIQAGTPSKTIDIQNIRKQLNEWNVGLDKHYDLFGVGHCHTGSITHLSNGTIFMTNGTLVPTDPFGLSLGHCRQQCGQWIWESTPGYIVGDHRFCTVGKDVDADKSLDKIILPYKGFNNA